jgi:phosphoglycerate dehydrogenase-like enzyme
MTHHVLCLRPEADFARVDALPPSSLKVEYHAPDDAKLAEHIREAEALVIPAVGPKLPAQLFENAALRIVQVTGAGVDRLDQSALMRLGIPVANVAGGSNNAVAEYAVTAASLLLRRFGWSDAEIKSGNYAKFRARMLADNLAGLEGLLIGVIGFGMIGRAVAQAFHRMGCRICYFDRAAGNPTVAEAIGAQSMTFDELLAQADVVTVHVPLLPDTRNLIGERELAKMKRTAVLIQGSRGGVVDEAALAASLNSGGLHGAAVDVYSSEPPPADNPLLALKGEAAHRLLLTPHIAGVTRLASTLLFRSAWENVVRVLVRNEPPLNRVF